jgi:hypothetical protein
MSPAGVPPGPLLSAWHRRFPDRLHLWVGSVRLWWADLPVRQPHPTSRLAEWATKAAALGPAGPADLARRLGLAESVVAAAGRPVRRSFAFLDLPGGPVAVSVPPESLSASPEPVSAEGVPPAVVRPPGVDVIPMSADWRTIPVIWAERLSVVAVGWEDGIEVYAAGPDWDIGDSPTWTLPANAVPAATPEDWAAAWREWCRDNRVPAAPEIMVEKGVARVQGSNDVAADVWLLAGDGSLREAAVIRTADQ